MKQRGFGIDLINAHSIGIHSEPERQPVFKFFLTLTLKQSLLEKPSRKHYFWYMIANITEEDILK